MTLLTADRDDRLGQLIRPHSRASVQMNYINYMHCCLYTIQSPHPHPDHNPHVSEKTHELP